METSHLTGENYLRFSLLERGRILLPHEHSTDALLIFSQISLMSLIAASA